MSDLLQATLNEVASLAADLARQAGKATIAPLVTAQCVVRADQLRNALRKLTAATPGRERA